MEKECEKHNYCATSDEGPGFKCKECGEYFTPSRVQKGLVKDFGHEEGNHRYKVLTFILQEFQLRKKFKRQLREARERWMSEIAHYKAAKNKHKN